MYSSKGKVMQSMPRSAGWALALSLVWLLSGCGADYGLDQHGRKVAAGALDDHWLVLNYWADWCSPCRGEIAQLNALSQQLPEGQVRVVGVNFDNLQGADLLKASDALGIQYTVLAENPAGRFALPDTEALPVTYLVDPQGKVREQWLGEQTAAGLLARLKAAGAL